VATATSPTQARRSSPLEYCSEWLIWTKRLPYLTGLLVVADQVLVVAGVAALVIVGLVAVEFRHGSGEAQQGMSDGGGSLLLVAGADRADHQAG
jgi:hypothetical protein